MPHPHLLCFHFTLYVCVKFWTSICQLCWCSPTRHNYYSQVASSRAMVQWSRSRVECNRVKESQVEPWLVVVESSRGKDSHPFKPYWLYYILLCLYLTLHDSTTHYHGSNRLYLTQLHSTVALLHSTMALLGSTWLNYTLPGSTTFYHASTWLYLPLLYSTLALPGSTHSTLALLHSVRVYYILPWPSLALLATTTL